MKTLLLTILLALTIPVLRADVVRPAPEFSWVDSTGARKSSKSLLGRPVILLIADSPRAWVFRAQVGQRNHGSQGRRIAREGRWCVPAAGPHGRLTVAHVHPHCVQPNLGWKPFLSTLRCPPWGPR